MITTPTIHSNGTSHKDLTEGYKRAEDALFALTEAFSSIEFNARDYYVQGPDVYTQARDQQREIFLKICDIKDYLEAILISLHDQTPKSRQ